MKRSRSPVLIAPIAYAALVVLTLAATVGALAAPSVAGGNPPAEQRARFSTSFVLAQPAASQMTPSGQQSPAAAASGYVPGELLVKFRDGAATPDRTSVLQGYQLSVISELLIPGAVRVKVTPGQELQWAAKLSSDPLIAYAEPNYYRYVGPPLDMQAAASAPGAPQLARTPDDTLFNAYQWNLRQINAPQAWDIATGSDAVILAVLDSGIDIGHPDLACANKITSGYDFYNNDNGAQDDYGHGTGVAGIAGACSDNGQGIAGVNWQVRIMPVKVIGRDGDGPVSAVVNGIIWAVNNGARVINLSLGSAEPSQAERDAVAYAHSRDVIVIASAGNEYEEGNPISYPAAYPHVLAVAATGDRDEHASYSNTGSYVDVAAPGGNPANPSDSTPSHWIMSTYWRGGGAPYQPMRGTSMAAPHVAGLAALLRGLNPALTADQIQAVIQSTAQDVGAPGRDDVFGHGRINMLAAALAVRGATATPTRTQPPVASTPTRTPTASPTRTATRTATTTPPTGWVTIVEETFEGDFPGAWRVFDQSLGDGEHVWAKRSCRSYAGGFSGWAIGGGADGAALPCGSVYPNLTTSHMLFGPFSLADASDAELSFKLWLNVEPAFDQFYTSASLDGLHFFSGDWTATPSNGWVDWVFDLTNVFGLGDLRGQPAVWIGLHFMSDADVTEAEGVYVDNILLRKFVSAEGTQTATATPTVTLTPSRTPTVTHARTLSPTRTLTATRTPTRSVTRTPTQPVSPPAFTATRTPTQPSSPPVETPPATRTATPTRPADAVLLRVDPASREMERSSGPITLAITIENVTDLGGFQFELGFDPQVISVTDISLAGFPASSGRTFIAIPPTIGSGSAIFVAFSVGDQPGPSGSGPLAVVTLQPTGSGQSRLDLGYVGLVTSNGVDIPVATEGGMITVTACLFADFNCDCVVDVYDLQLAAAHWHTTPASPNWDPQFDVDNDGDVDVFDLQRVAAAWGTHCTSDAAGRSQLVAPPFAAAGSAIVSVEPQTTTVALSTRPAVVAVNIHNVQNLGGFQFELRFDPTVVSVTQVLLASYPASGGRTFVALPTAMYADRVVFAAFSFGEQAGVTGSGPLAIVTLQPAAAGMSLLELASVNVVDAAGSAIAAATRPGWLVIQPPSRVVLPIIVATW